MELARLMAKRLYSRDGIEIWHGDADGFDWPADIDLLLTDPPYGKVVVSNRTDRGEAIDGDVDQDKIDRIVQDVWRRMRNHRHGYIFGPRRPIEATYAELIWDKVYMASGDLSAAWGTSHENIGFYAHRYKSEPTAGALSARLRQGSVLRVAGGRGSTKRYHPNDKPVRLMQQLMESSSNVGDLVVDPFCGGGSSAVAALLLGRRYVGVELDLKFAKRAADRLAELAQVGTIL